MAKRHDVHHFIPAFLLRPWQSGHDDRLTALAWKGGRVNASRRNAKAVAKLTGLYALRDVPEDKANVVEAQIFQRIDDDGAAAHAKLTRGRSDLTSKEMDGWARFIVSLLTRSPWFLQRHVDAAPGVMLATLMKNPIEGFDQSDALDKMLELRPDLPRDMALRGLVSILPKSRTQDAIMGCPWAIVDVSESSRDLVIGDRPVLRTGTFDTDFLLALPISPTMLFLMHSSNSSAMQALRRLSPRELVERANRESAHRAIDYVYATSDEHEALALRYLREPGPVTP